MAKFGPTEPFDFSCPAEWLMWRQRFSRFRVASKLDKESGEVQVNLFLYSMGRDAEPIYSLFVFPTATEANPHPESDFKIVVEKFDEHFVPRRTSYTTVPAFISGTRGQMRSWKRLSRACMSWHSTVNSATVISDKEVSQRLQLEADLTLERAIQLACQSDQVKQQSAEGV